MASSLIRAGVGEHSAHPSPTGRGAGGEGAHHDNLLIQGDNLDALKALLPFYRGRVKCIFIDPPYNTKSAFEHYDDNLEHSQWLSMMYPRLVLLRELLAEDGSIWVTIDDNEGHYLKVLMDEVFGRQNFVANVVWQSKDTPGNNAVGMAETHNHILVLRKTSAFQFSLLPRNEDQLANYTNPDNDPRGDWLAAPLTRAEFRERDFYALKNQVGKDVYPPKGSSWRRPPEKMRWLQEDGRIWWGKNGDGEFPMEKKFLSEAKEGVVNKTWWPYEFAGSTRNASSELKGIFEGEKVFDTPKPERIVMRALEIATQPGDLVLDSFLGSGTTAAVAHKMGRRWIGIEMGGHAETHCLPRLQKVIEGEQGGISQAVNWQGGGGFRFLRLGEAMFNADGSIHPAVRFATLAGFVWMQETGAPLEQNQPTPALPYQGGSSITSPDKGRAGGVKRSGEGNKTPLLGAHEGRGIYLLFNGILGDKRPQSGNVLTQEVLAAIRQICPFSGEKIIYGEACRLGEKRLAAEGITFKHIPYDVRAR
ncbi:MAG: site-specific DNA-methyltransferase [Gallionellaceae bacterium]|nr:MAG: site-specific DNA-methyltransferase [Gallionellaceae bacterium]